MKALTQPALFLKTARPFPILAAALFLLALGLALVFAAPPDYQQGGAVRILFVHVPAAWMALGAYCFLAAASAAALVWRTPLADIAAHAAALPGAGFTFLALGTGALWGQPIWGRWWVWDARLTSVLVLLFFYLGYIALRRAFDDPARAALPAAILALAGLINVPIVKFSVTWWATLHQPASLLRAGGSAIHPVFLPPLLVMGAGFALFFLALLLIRMESEILRRKTRARHLRRLKNA